MILVLNKMSTEGQGNTTVKITKKDNRRKRKGIGKNLKESKRNRERNKV